MEAFLKVGVITAPHGVRGEVKVFPTTDDPQRFQKLKQIYLDDRGAEEREVSGVKFAKQLVILKLSEIESRDEAEIYRNRELYVARADALPLGEDEYYIADLLGAQVQTEEDEVLGTLTDVLQTGANDVYVVTSDAYGEILIPAIRQCIRKVDIEAARVVVQLLPGLLPKQQGGTKP